MYNEREGVQGAEDMEGDRMASPNIDIIDSDEEEEIDDLSLSYLDEQSNIEATNLGVEKKYRDYIRKNDIATTHFPILRAMATGLSDSDRLDRKFEACVSKGWLSKKQVNVTKDLLKDELSRRFELAKQCEEDGLPKRTKLTGSAQQLVQRMGGGAATHERTFPLVHLSEQHWVRSTIRKGLKDLKAAKTSEATERRRSGEGIKTNVLLKMRLTHGELLCSHGVLPGGRPSAASSR